MSKPLDLLRCSSEHSRLALATRDPYERMVRLRLAQRATLQALALMLGPCGVRAPSRPPEPVDGNRITQASSETAARWGVAS